MRFNFLFLSFLFLNNVIAQNSDCNTAFLLTDTVYQQSSAPLGFGKIRELVQPGKYDSTSFKSEKNSEWFILNQPINTILSLSITPDNINDDYDFMIFDASVPAFCDSIKVAGKLKAIRSNISRNDKSINSVTGLNNLSDTSFVGIGVGNSFCEPLLMDASKPYYLVVCCDRNPQKGFSLKLNYQKIASNSLAVDSLLAKIEAESKRSRNKLQMFFADAETKLGIAADVVIRTNLIDTGFVINGQSTYTIAFKSHTDIMAIAPGYMIEKRNYLLPEDSLSIVDTIYLKKIISDAYLEIIPFYFEGNTNILLPKSKPALSSLLLFLQKNPKVKIEIQGHANGPKRKNLKEFRRLSENRAEAIKKYLTFQGVNKKSLLVEGFGNAMMLFPDPQTEEESELNRRVEIKIVSVE
jgi:flagellar motor protein MotB